MAYEIIKCVLTFTPCWKQYTIVLIYDMINYFVSNIKHYAYEVK